MDKPYTICVDRKEAAQMVNLSPIAFEGAVSAEQAGKLMQRVVFDGHEYFLPIDAAIWPSFPKDGNEAEKKKWIDDRSNETLSGTY